MKPRDDVERWAWELAKAAADFGLVELPPGFSSLPDHRQAEIGALELCRLRQRAIAGDAEVDAFFRLHRHWPKPPGPGAGDATASGPLRVGIASPSFTSPGGAEEWVAALVRSRPVGIAWVGVAVTGPDWDAGTVEASRTQAPVILGPDSVRVLGRACDVLLVWGIEDFPAFAGPTEAKVVAVSHGSGEWTRALLRGSRSWADHRVAVSAAARDGFGGRPDDVAVIWNGVDPARVDVDEGREATRAKWGLKSRERAVCFLGRLSWEKDPVGVCRACAALGSPWRPVVVGDGWKREEVHRAAREIAPDVILPGFVQRPGDALAAADVFVLSSPSEGFSLGLIEAWLAGVPVVATPVGSIPEVESRFGSLVTRVPIGGSADDLARGVREALSRRGRARARRALKVAREHFTEAAMVARWAGFLRAVGNSAGSA